MLLEMQNKEEKTYIVTKIAQKFINVINKLTVSWCDA